MLSVDNINTESHHQVSLGLRIYLEKEKEPKQASSDQHEAEISFGFQLGEDYDCHGVCLDHDGNLDIDVSLENLKRLKEEINCTVELMEALRAQTPL